MIKKALWITCLALSALLCTGCNNGGELPADALPDPAEGTFQAEAAVTAPPSPTATANGRRAIVQATARPADKSVALLKEDVPEYSGGGRLYMIAGEEVSADFSAHRTLPLGVLMPETMKRFETGGGTAWGTADEQNFIALFAEETSDDADIKESLNKQNLTNWDNELLKYKEYRGNYMDRDTAVDVFSVEAKGKHYIAEIRTLAAQRENLLPVFVNMLQDVQYMEKKPPIVPGVFVQVPDVGSSAEHKQVLQEVMDCLEAMATKNKEQFTATMSSPETAERLHYFIDNTSAYRFYKLTSHGIPVEGEKWAGFQVDYYLMDEEGYIADRAFMIVLLRDKQGVWKIVDID